MNEFEGKRSSSMECGLTVVFSSTLNGAVLRNCSQSLKFWKTIITMTFHIYYDQNCTGYTHHTDKKYWQQAQCDTNDKRSCSRHYIL